MTSGDIAIIWADLFLAKSSFEWFPWTRFHYFDMEPKKCNIWRKHPLPKLILHILVQDLHIDAANHPKNIIVENDFTSTGLQLGVSENGGPDPKQIELGKWWQSVIIHDHPLKFMFKPIEWHTLWQSNRRQNPSMIVLEVPFSSGIFQPCSPTGIHNGHFFMV